MNQSYFTEVLSHPVIRGDLNCEGIDETLIKWVKRIARKNQLFVNPLEKSVFNAVRGVILSKEWKIQPEQSRGTLSPGTVPSNPLLGAL